MTGKYDYASKKHKHLSLEDRMTVQQGLLMEKSFRQLGEELGKDPGTISKEIRRNFSEMRPKFFGVPRNMCSKRQICLVRGLCGHYPHCPVDYCHRCSGMDCNEICQEYEPTLCPTLLKPPYVCNSCEKSRKCHQLKRIYDAKTAEKKYRTTLTKAREGINLTMKELEEVDLLLGPLVEKGQSLHHIWSSHKDELPVKIKTLYTYADKGYFSFRNIDLPRRVRYKKRKRKQLENAPHPNYRRGRTYQDFQEYLKSNPDTRIVEMDTVEGPEGANKVILTQYFRSLNLLLAFLLERKTQAAVRQAFDNIEALLGIEVFRTIFPAILTDNGSEFKDPLSLELSPTGEKRTEIFYCDPQASWQKPGVERSHGELRRILPKGTSFDALTQKQIFLVRDHVNSLKRESLNGRCAFELGTLLLPKEAIRKLLLKHIPPDEVILRPSLLKK